MVFVSKSQCYNVLCLLFAAFQEYVVTQFENIRQCFKDVERSQILLSNKLDSVLRSTGSSSFNTELPEDFIFSLTRPLQVEEMEEKLQDDQSLQDCLVLYTFSLCYLCPSVIFVEQFGICMKQE